MIIRPMEIEILPLTVWVLLMKGECLMQLLALVVSGKSLLALVVQVELLALVVSGESLLALVVQVAVMLEPVQPEDDCIV